MPRAGLTPERIVAQAATVADEAGLDHLTLAAVAKRCGVSLPGLYKHLSGLDEVKRGISILAVNELTTEIARATVGVSGHEALRALTGAYRRYALAHPGRYAASVRAPAPGDTEHADTAAQAIAVLAAALKEYGLEGSDLIHAIRMLRMVCHGAASLEAAGGFALPEDLDQTYGHLVDMLDAALRRLAPRQERAGTDDGR
jgi:AcrR family transcriptional regulator